MNQIKVNGILAKTEHKYAGRQGYELAVKRKSGTVDTLLVLSEKEDLPEGPVYVEGTLHASYIHSIGRVPVTIFPDTVEPGEDTGYSKSEITGVLKDKPKCRTTKGNYKIASAVVLTDDGPVPVLAWNERAVEAESLNPGDRVRAEGRLQSRQYPDKNREWHTTYELSSRGFEPVSPA